MVPGANSELRPAHVDRVLPTLEPSVVLVQMEIPPETVARAAALGQGAGARVLLDPAPVPASLSDALMTNVDLLLPNEGELATLTGLPVESVDAAARAAATLRCRGVRAVVVKRGSHRALVVDAKSARSVPAPRVDVIDTTWLCTGMLVCCTALGFSSVGPFLAPVILVAVVAAGIVSRPRRYRVATP